MKSRLQIAVLLVLLVISIVISNKYREATTIKISSTPPVPAEENGAVASNTPEKKEAKKIPSRKWDVLDPAVNAEGILVQSLDSGFSFFNYQTYKEWPIASITKLLTAIVVIENIGEDKKIPVSDSAIKTEGGAGDFRSGEVYSARDLIKIMLITSSNDAASAFEEYAGGRDKFLVLLRAKAAEIGMAHTTLNDASGLSKGNTSNANDLLKLAKYIVEKHPDILSWTRIQSLIVQPLNDASSRTIYNIDPFASDFTFLGGKTGTLPIAKENILAFFTFGNDRIVCIILGSSDRVKEIHDMFSWIKTAYTFPQ